MAIRNVNGIARQGRMIAQEHQNARDLREGNFWNRVSMVQECMKDAIDFIDTVKFLEKNGLTKRFEEWMKDKNVRFESYRNLICVTCLSSKKESAVVGYYPQADAVHFGWNGNGMCESYTIGSKVSPDANYFINNRLSKQNYDEGLTMLATRLRPFLNAFFEWVDTI